MKMNKNLENIFAKQKKLADYCLKGSSLTDESFYSDHIFHYQRLVSNVFQDSLASAFPLTKNFLSNDEWDFLIEEFMTNHKCQTPFVWKMPYEFYLYVSSRKFQLHKQYLFLNDLLKFEWYEIKIYMASNKILKLKKYTDKEFIINPNHKLIKLNYPVHTKNAALIRDNDREEYYALLFRETKNFRVIFNDLSILMAAVCEIISLNPINIEELINFIKSNLLHDLDDKMINRIKSFIDWGVSNQLFFTNIKGSIYV